MTEDVGKAASTDHADLNRDGHDTEKIARLSPHLVDQPGASVFELRQVSPDAHRLNWTPAIDPDDAKTVWLDPLEGLFLPLNRQSKLGELQAAPSIDECKWMAGICPLHLRQPGLHVEAVGGGD